MPVNILAIDTSGPYLGVAIAKNDSVITKRVCKKAQSHSKLLAPTVAELLKKTRLKPKDIGLYVISIGPGSFTGLRIGVAFIKGMNLFVNKPISCVPTLDAMAYEACRGLINQTPTGFICPIVDAKRNNVYAAIYKVKNVKINIHPLPKGEACPRRGRAMVRGSDSNAASSSSSSPQRGEDELKKISIKRISKYFVIPVSEVLSKIKGDAPITFTGDGIDIYKEEIVNVLGDKAIFAKKSLWYPKPDTIVKMGYQLHIDGKSFNEVNPVRESRRLKPIAFSDGVNKLTPMYLYPRDIQCRK